MKIRSISLKTLLLIISIVVLALPWQTVKAALEQANKNNSIDVDTPKA